ncbi:undecaprenyl/decaprenyl-phosphate alpha-N-acetylglucosaminyl 1-phosphate transferase [Candidatus Pelagibacter sp.]|nr:undecaprenyl/decaprenyl-phosphate alpha-N-acetylglucosaminyl 1-phosphate transferase [Candidatus Pelagibacter sp.]
MISYKLNLLDIPNKRKMHLKPTAYTGGLALCFIYIFAIFLFNFPSQKLDLILSIAFLIGVVGFIDDKYSLNVGGKLSLQIIPIIYLILLENFNLNQIGDYDYFKLELNSFSVPFTLLSVMFLINSFNYFDGLDGTLSFVTISVLSILFFLIPNEKTQLFLITILLPILIFLCFNFSIFKLPKLFFGDSGSLLLGFIISFTVIYLANQKIVHPILLAFSISIFVYEFLSINLIRIINKKKIFGAGVDHLHHILLKKNKSLSLTNFLISIMNIIFFIFGYLSFKFINPLTSLILFIVLFIIFFILRKKLH